MIKMNKLKLIVVLGFFATVHAGKFIKWFNGVQGYNKKTNSDWCEHNKS